MPRNQSEAIVLRTSPFSEQDKIVVFFARDSGILKGVAKGARKFGNRFGSSLEPLSHVKVFFYEKEGRDLVTVSNCDLIESYFELQTDLDTSFTLNYFAELIENALPSRTEDDILFRLTLLILQRLKTGVDLGFLTAYFEVWFLKINGFLLNLSHCKKCRKAIEKKGWLSPKKDGIYCHQCTPSTKDEIDPDLKSFIEWVKKNPPPARGDLPYSPEQIQAIRKILKDIITYHMEHAPKSLSYLK
jgi:DNA repair protein RecO (recombination protein O)